MGKITIIEGNSNEKDDVRVLFAKGEAGTSPTAKVTKEGDIATIEVTDENGTTSVDVIDGYNPTIEVTNSTGKTDIDIDDITGQAHATINNPVVSITKTDGVASISVTDKDGTRSATVSDGADLTDGAVPTGAVVGFDGVTIPGGFEETNIYEEGSWTPTINTIENVAPTINYTTNTGNYKKIGKLVFISFYIKGKITALNGTDNYGIVAGLPFQLKSTIFFGENVIPIGVLNDLTQNTGELNLLPYANTLRMQHDNGTTATKLKVTSGDYFELGGCGWYITE